MQELLEIIISYGYIIIFIYSFAGGSLALLTGGVLAAMGKLDLAWVLVLAGAGNFIGDWFFFSYSKFLKTHFNSDVNKVVSKYRRKVAYTKLLIRKKGWIGVFIQKYIYIVRTMYPITLGLMGYSPKKFFMLNLLATIFWVFSVGLTSYYFSDAIFKFFN